MLNEAHGHSHSVPKLVNTNIDILSIKVHFPSYMKGKCTRWVRDSLMASRPKYLQERALFRLDLISQVMHTHPPSRITVVIGRRPFQPDQVHLHHHCPIGEEHLVREAGPVRPHEHAARVYHAREQVDVRHGFRSRHHYYPKP